MIDPSDKGTAVITGASSGIGAIYADRLARRGYNLILIARSREKLAALARTISKETGRSVKVVPADLADHDDLRRVEADLREDASISLLVNNAGAGTHKALLDSDAEAMETMIDINVIAPTRLTYAVVPRMVERGRGTIINIASIAALRPEALNGVYGGSKAYIQAFSTSLNHELADKGIRTQAVMPGATATDFWKKGGLPVEHLPPAIVMDAGEMVDAALAGLDLGERVTIPSLPDLKLWQDFESAREALGPNLSRSEAADRYKGRAAL